MEWKPIESAEVEQYEPNPRLLVSDKWGNLYIAQYAPDNSCDGSYSWFAQISNGCHCNEIEPVAYMPLPPPPAIGENDE